MRQTALAWMIGEPGARQLARGGLVAIVQELDQGERAAASRSRSEVMEERAGMNDQRPAVADPPIAFTGIVHGPTRLYGELHGPCVKPHNLGCGENRLLEIHERYFQFGLDRPARI